VILITARAAGPYQAANWEFIGDAEQTISVFVLAALAFWNAPAAFASLFSSTVQRTLLVKPAAASTPCGDRHPCCAKSAPGNSAIVPAETTSVRPGLEKRSRPQRTNIAPAGTRRAPESAASRLSSLLPH